MPTDITWKLIGVWCCVGFFTGAGWALGSWLMSRLLLVFFRP